MNKIFFLDNQDSFTYNLVEELKSLNFEVEVYRNTVPSEFIIEKIEIAITTNQDPVLFLSPGPGTPSQSVCMTELLEFAVGKLPIIGVCLGHQAIAEHYGGKVRLAGETVHGKASTINIKPHNIFAGFGNAIQVARYHSLVVDDLPSTLEVIGVYKELVMAVINEDDRVLGFQFHPESILTTQGSALIRNSIKYLTGNK